MVSILTSELSSHSPLQTKAHSISSPLYSSLLALEQGGKELIVSAVHCPQDKEQSCHLAASELTSGVSIDLQACLCHSLPTPLLPASSPFCPLVFLSIKPVVTPHLSTPLLSPVVQLSRSGVQFPRTWGCTPQQPLPALGTCPLCLPAQARPVQDEAPRPLLAPRGQRGGRNAKTDFVSVASKSSGTRSTQLSLVPCPSLTTAPYSRVFQDAARACGGEDNDTCLTLELHSINWAPPLSWHSLPASAPLGVCLAVTSSLTQSLFPLDMSQ